MKSIIFFILSFFFFCCSQESPTNKKSNKFTVVANIDLRFEGCFGGGVCKLQVLAQNGERTALFTNDNNAVYKTKIDSSGFKKFNQFISELKETNFDYSCTNTDYYFVTIGSEKFTKTDGSCSWGGFNDLIKYLFSGHSLVLYPGEFSSNNYKN